MSISMVDEDMEDEERAVRLRDARRRRRSRSWPGTTAGVNREDRAIHHIWPDFPLKPLINKSISTVKADAAHNSFAAGGAGIVWAVIDSGIDENHPHFTKYKNLELTPPLEHRDFTGGDAPLEDVKGHGTHVAGIIAGQFDVEDDARPEARSADRRHHALSRPQRRAGGSGGERRR